MVLVEITPDQITGLVICLTILWVVQMGAILGLAIWLAEQIETLQTRLTNLLRTPLAICSTNPNEGAGEFTIRQQFKGVALDPLRWECVDCRSINYGEDTHCRLCGLYKTGKCPSCESLSPHQLGWTTNQLNQLEACTDVYHAPDCIQLSADAQTTKGN